jgi:hypothetical protein
MLLPLAQGCETPLRIQFLSYPPFARCSLLVLRKRCVTLRALPLHPRAHINCGRFGQ